jgi:hypothetical protein
MGLNQWQVAGILRSLQSFITTTVRLMLEVSVTLKLKISGSTASSVEPGIIFRNQVLCMGSFLICTHSPLIKSME